MTNFNEQMPIDGEFDTIMCQTETKETVKKSEKISFDTRNYLDFTIPEGKKSREVTIRLLPVKYTAEGKPEYFQIVKLHNITVNKELSPNKSGKKAYICLDSSNTGIDHNVYGDNCPICEYQKEIWKQWHLETDENKKKELAKEAGSFNVRDYCIVRCIERGKESEGPKFWRIPIRQDQTDAYNKILLLAKTRYNEGLEAGIKINIFSIYEGRDLIVTFTEGTGAPTIVDKGVSTPVTSNGELLKQWCYDEKKWSDVFCAKPYDYLKIVLEGEVPWYDKNNQHWVTKTEYEKNKSNQEYVINEQIHKVEQEIVSSITNSPTTEVFASNQNNAQNDTDLDNHGIPSFDDELPF